MPRVALKIGEHSIATSRPYNRGKKKGNHNPDWYLQWYANVDGEARRYTTEITNATLKQLYDLAYAKFDRLMEQAKLPGDGAWTAQSRMGEFVNKICIPAVEANEYARPLRPATQERYLRCLRLYAAECGNIRIANATVPDRLERTFKTLAVEHGNSTANQSAKVVSRYVMDVLVRKSIIEHNPLKPRTFEVTVAEDTDRSGKKPEGGVALLPEQRKQVVDYLLGLDPTTTPKRGSYSAEQLTAKRRALIEITLLQATCGFRIGEMRFLERRDVAVDGDRVTVTVRPEVSKTHKGRTVPVLDARVAERIEQRLQSLSNAPETLVFPAPCSGKVWDRRNLTKAVRAFYDGLAEELGIPVLATHSSHVWRATLNSEWTDLGVSPERRAAYFGHSPEINVQSYTDLVDLSVLERQVAGA